MINQQHNIEKISVNVNTSSARNGNLYKDNLPEVINKAFLTDADKLFSSICSENEDLFIDKITIEIDTDSNTDFRVLKEQLLHQLKEKIGHLNVLQKTLQLNNSTSTKEETTPHKSYNLKEGYVYYLKTGLKPWWLNQSKLDDILNGNWENVFKKTEDCSNIIEAILSNKIVQTRFIKQQKNAVSTFYFFAKEVMHAEVGKELIHWNDAIKNYPYNIRFLIKEELYPLIFDYISQKSETTIINHKSVLSLKTIYIKWLKITPDEDLPEVKTKLEIFTDLTMSLWDAVSNGKINLKPFRNELRDFLQKPYEQSVKPQLSNKQLLQEEDTEILNQKEIKADSEDFPPTIYLSHAGLILVYPFIKELFKSCGLLSSSGDISHLNEAVHLLHYVATKNLNPAEYEVTLEKLLCGIPLQTPIEREVILKDSQILEAEEMLKAVSENWPAVKNSSPDALRNTFLIRDGKLEIINFDKRLIVQRKTEDILIDKIPWSISIVKTPWMKEFLTVEW